MDSFSSLGNCSQTPFPDSVSKKIHMIIFFGRGGHLPSMLGKPGTKMT